MLLAGTPNKKERFGRLGIESVYLLISSVIRPFFKVSSQGKSWHDRREKSSKLA